MWAVDNPVIVRELRVRMRGNRALWMQAAYVGVLSAVLLIGYWQAIQQADAVADGRLGELMFGWLSTPWAVLSQPNISSPSRPSATASAC